MSKCLSKPSNWLSGCALAGLLVLAMGAGLQPATAGENTGVNNTNVSVQVNMARILRIGSPAATVIVGNPGVADVTIQDPQTLVLTGRSYGNTNLILLDAVGNPIADIIIEVIQGQQGLMTVYQGSARTTLACSPNCQPTIMLGDDVDFTSGTIASSSLVATSAN